MIQPHYLAIRTCDRPAYLQRLLRSLSRRNAEIAVCVLVFDDSRHESSQLRNRQIVYTARRRFGFEVQYLGTAWQQEFMSNCVRLVPEAAASIQWLLAPRPAGFFTGGRLFNLVILALAGHRFTLFDDDFLLDRARHLGNGHTRKVTWSNGPAQLARAYSSIGECRDAGVELDADPVETHLGYLGRRLQDCLRPATRMSAPLLDATLSGPIPQELRLDEDSIILTTVNGQYGVPIAPGYFHAFYQPEGESRIAWEDPVQYRLLRRGKAVWNVTSSMVISGKAASTPSGVDNRHLMPPVNPYGRGEDTLFGAMLKFLHPNAAQLYLPWGLEHSRQAAPWRHRTFNRWTTISLASRFRKRTEQLTTPTDGHHTPEGRLQSLASDWQAWSAQPQDALADDIREVYKRGLLWRARVMSESLALVPDPDLQAHRDLSQSLERLGTFLESGLALPGVDEHPAIQDDAGKIQCLATTGRDFGLALGVWARLWHAGKELQAVS